MNSQPTPAVTVTLRGNVGAGTVSYAQEKVGTVLAEVRKPVLGAQVVLDWHRDPALRRPARADVGVNVNGTIIRAGSERPTMQEAIDEMEARLRRRIRTFAGRERRHRRDAASTSTRGAGPDHTVSVPRPRTAAHEQVLDERVESGPALAPEEASYEMDRVDHDFYLYQDAITDSPALLRRDGPHAYTVDTMPPRLTDTQPLAQLNHAAEPLVFYRHAASGEVRVLHEHPDGRRACITLSTGR